MKPKKFLLEAMLVMAGWTCGPTAHADLVWSLVDDYDIQMPNPNGVWSYGWEQTLTAPLTLYNATRYDQWYDASHTSGDYTPTVWKNNDTVAHNNIVPGEVSLHPGWDNSFSVVRWTAPVTGTVDISGHFGAGDGGWMSYYIADNNVVLSGLQWLSDPGTEYFTFRRSVIQGETLDFIVGVPIGGGYGYGNTPLDVTLTASVPEPENLAMMLAGLAVLVPLARRRA